MNLFPSLNIQSFGSSSKGNCTVIWDDETAVLVDFGFYPGVIEKRLKQINRRISGLDGVLLTHNHIDHFNPNFVNTLVAEKIPIYCHEDILEPTLLKYRKYLGNGARSGFSTFTGAEFNINTFNVRAFPVPHDSEGGCYGYRITGSTGSGCKQITIATDIAHTRNGTVEHFIDSDLIMIESNHDVQMLKNSGRPAFLVRRIIEDGHLSNEECASFVVDVLRKSRILPSVVMLAHISQDCNTPQKAEACSRAALEANKFTQVETVLTYCGESSRIVSL